jgi:hypothetical protein
MRLFLALVMAAVLAGPAAACPLCKEAVQSPGDNTSLSEEEQQAVKEARAWNNSIYLFVGMPYLLVGGVGFMVYRSFKKARQAANPEPKS